MEPNPILTEIRATRDELARRSGYNVRKFMDFIRERERASAKRGVTFAPFARVERKAKPAAPESSVVREEPGEI